MVARGFKVAQSPVGTHYYPKKHTRSRDREGAVFFLGALLRRLKSKAPLPYGHGSVGVSLVGVSLVGVSLVGVSLVGVSLLCV